MQIGIKSMIAFRKAISSSDLERYLQEANDVGKDLKDSEKYRSGKNYSTLYWGMMKDYVRDVLAEELSKNPALNKEFMNYLTNYGDGYLSNNPNLLTLIEDQDGTGESGNDLIQAYFPAWVEFLTRMNWMKREGQDIPEIQSSKTVETVDVPRDIAETTEGYFTPENITNVEDKLDREQSSHRGMTEEEHQKFIQRRAASQNRVESKMPTKEESERIAANRKKKESSDQEKTDSSKTEPPKPEEKKPEEPKKKKTTQTYFEVEKSSASPIYHNNYNFPMEDSIQSMMKSKRVARYSRDSRAEHERFYSSVLKAEMEEGLLPMMDAPADMPMDDSFEDEQGATDEELLQQLTEFLDALEESDPEVYDEALEFLSEMLDLSDEEIAQIEAEVESTPHEDEAMPMGKSAGFRVNTEPQAESFRQIMQRGAFKKRTSYYGADPVGDNPKTSTPQDRSDDAWDARRRYQQAERARAPEREANEAREREELANATTPEAQEALRQKRRMSMPGYDGDAENKIGRELHNAEVQREADSNKQAEEKEARKRQLIEDTKKKRREERSETDPPKEQSKEQPQEQPAGQPAERPQPNEPMDPRLFKLKQKRAKLNQQWDAWKSKQEAKEGNIARNRANAGMFGQVMHSMFGDQRDAMRQALQMRKKHKMKAAQNKVDWDLKQYDQQNTAQPAAEGAEQAKPKKQKPVKEKADPGKAAADAQEAFRQRMAGSTV